MKIVYTTQFKRDYKRARKQHRELADLEKRIEVIEEKRG